MKRKTIFAIAMALALVLFAVPAFAAPTAGKDSKYDELGGTSTQFTKYLITNQGQDIPDIEFKYTIEPGQEVKASDGIFEIKAGIVKKDADDKVTDPTFDDFATFDAKGGKDASLTGIWTEVQTGDTLDAANLTAGKQYSKDNVTINFDDIKFTEPGVYRYIITELPVKDQVGITYDIDEKKNPMKRVLDVYVVDDPEGQLKIQEYVLHSTESSIKTTEGNGSKDENLDETVATGWQISDDPTVTYKTKEEAETELARRKSWPTDDPNYDSSILAKQKEIDDLKKGTNGNDNDYGTAGTDGIDYAEKDLGKATADAKDKQDAVDAAQKAVDDLEKGTSTYGPQDIKDALEALKGDASDTRFDSALEAHGKNKLVEVLNDTTDTTWITVLRRVIGKIEPKLTAANDTLSQKQSELAAAQATIDAKQAVLDARNEDLKKLEAELDAFVKAHDEAKVVEVTWKLKDKSDHYTNKISVYDLYFSKEVKGNQGSRDKYFKYTLTIKGLEDGQTVNLAGNWTKTITDANKGTATTYAADAMTTANNVSTLTADGTTITHDFYLKHGEYISVLDLQEGAGYTLTEVAEDYKSEKANSIVLGEVKQVTETYWYIYNNNNERPDKVTDEYGQPVDNKFTTEDDAKGITENTTQHQGWSYASETVVKVPGQAGQACTDDPSGTMTKNIYTGFTNTKDGIIPTGVLMSVSGGVLLAVIAIVGLIVLNRRRAEED